MQKETGILDTLSNDVEKADFWHTMKREYRELHEFYIDSDRKKRLLSMGRFKRVMYIAAWILQGMFYKLTPARRLLIVAGILLSINGITFKFASWLVGDRGLLGALLLFFVLMLELKDKLLAHDELDAGRTIQRALLPPEQPNIPGWSVWLFTRPAREVGGDLVDIIDHDSKTMSILMADVSGKGLRAALWTAKLQATIRALITMITDPLDLVDRVNKIFHRDSLRSVFASMVLLRVNKSSGQIQYVNAGHLPPVLCNRDGKTECGRGQLAIGLSPSSKYVLNELTMAIGDVLVSFSDGVTEAANENGEFYGNDKPLQIAERLRNSDAPVIGKAILLDLERFVGESPASDDISIIILKRHS
ncbi:MAG TPA: PP2C family protein-serine/threonine phosphatase [bacterium]|nr:PP2C family protein-serine/threonine phosphatase [bacterium]